MAQQTQNKMKGTSPSKSIQQAVDTAWGAQAKNTTNPQQAISQQYNKKPVTVPGGKK